MAGAVVHDLSVSLIIPTYNRAASLRRFLRSLDAAEKPGWGFEVVIVNNGSSDCTAQLIDEETKRPRDFALWSLDEKRRGKANAVNRGLGVCRGDIIVIFDDDVVIHPRCLVGHIEIHSSTAFDAVQGRVLPGLDPEGNTADRARLAAYNIPIVDYGESQKPIFGLIGTNVSFKRRVYEKVGCFNPRLGPGAAGFSEDTEYSNRIRAAGFAMGYAPSAVVYHELDPARYGRSYNLSVEYRKGASRSLYRKDSLVFHVVPNLLGHLLRYLFYRALRKTGKIYENEGRVAKSCGYLWGRLTRQNRKLC